MSRQFIIQFIHTNTTPNTPISHDPIHRLYCHVRVDRHVDPKRTSGNFFKSPSSFLFVHAFCILGQYPRITRPQFHAGGHFADSLCFDKGLQR